MHRTGGGAWAGPWGIKDLDSVCIAQSLWDSGGFSDRLGTGIMKWMVVVLLCLPLLEATQIK